MEKSVNKIPYDDVPISRSRNVGQTRRAWPTSPREQKYAQPSRGTTKVTSAKNTSSVQIQKKHVFGILFALLLVLNIVLCTLLVQAVAQNKFAQQIQQDNIIQVYPNGTENASAVTAKTLFSVVAISAGEDTHVSAHRRRVPFGARNCRKVRYIQQGHRCDCEERSNHASTHTVRQIQNIARQCYSAVPHVTARGQEIWKTDEGYEEMQRICALWSRTFSVRTGCTGTASSSQA